jgi:hypothetical protein
MAILTRRALLTGAAASAGLAGFGLSTQPANAFIFLLLRSLAAGSAIRGAAGLAGRSSLAGTALLRPSRSAYVRSPYRDLATAGRAIYRAGRWLNEDHAGSGLATYSDPDEYRWDYAQHPELFGAVPASFVVENPGDEERLMPASELWLQFDDGHVWQSYEIEPFCVPPGEHTSYVALAGVPTGWSFSAVYSTEYGVEESEFIPA